MYFLEESKKKIAAWFKKEGIEEIGKHFLRGKLSVKEMETLLTKVKIYNASVDHNNYGEFLFINFEIDGKFFFAFGLGIHEYRQKFYDFFQIEMGNNYKILGYEEIPHHEAYQAFIDRKREMREVEQDVEQDAEGKLFDEIADLTDDDFAYTELYL